MSSQLNIEDTELSSKIPLIYNIIGLLQSQTNDENKNTSNNNQNTTTNTHKHTTSERNNMTFPLPTEQNKDVPTTYTFSKKN